MSDKDELADLLGELGATEPLSEVPDKVKKKKEKGDGHIVVPKRTRKSKSVVQKLAPQPVEVDKVDTDLTEVFNDQFKTVLAQYGEIFCEIIQNYKSDREQAQEVIDAFMDVVARGGKIPRIYIEKIADVIRAKTEIALTAIKALDAVPKLISASKGSDVLVQNNVAFDSSTLAALLAAPEYDDEKVIDGQVNVLDVEAEEKAD